MNADDAIYTNTIITDVIFEYISHISCNGAENCNASDRIDIRIIIVPETMVPKIALSALFNIPTLAAYEDGCDYFYLVNDDLQFISLGWTELLVEPLAHNPLYQGLGVSGGVDLSDTITPQIEFPFFHRTHVLVSIVGFCIIGDIVIG